MLWVKLPVVNRIQPQSIKFATGVENIVTGDSKFNDSPASVDIVYGTDPWFYFQLIEGFRGKRAYIAFLADFHFLQDQANFWQTDLFWHEKHRSVIVSDDLRFVLQKERMQKDSVLREAAS